MARSPLSVCRRPEEEETTSCVHFDLGPDGALVVPRPDPRPLHYPMRRRGDHREDHEDLHEDHFLAGNHEARNNGPWMARRREQRSRAGSFRPTPPRSEPPGWSSEQLPPESLSACYAKIFVATDPDAHFFSSTASSIDCRSSISKATGGVLRTKNRQRAVDFWMILPLPCHSWWRK